LKLVTLNPAIQLGIDKRVGSIDVGKDADLAIYNHDPLSAYAVVQKTLIDGRVYFDREKDLAGRATLEKEKKDLLEKARKKQDEEKKAGAKKPEEKKAEEKKTDEKKPEEKKTEEKKPEDKPKPPQGDAGQGGAL
jgi:adenine deaminase